MLIPCNPFPCLKAKSMDKGEESLFTLYKNIGKNKKLDDLQIRMMIWELEGYMDGLHLKPSTDQAGGSGSTGRESQAATATKTFASLMNTPQKQSMFLQDHQSVKDRLETLCRQLTHEYSTKAMAELRKRVLETDPHLPPEELAEAFRSILTQTLEEQRKTFPDYFEDHETSLEQVGRRVSSAAWSIKSFFSQSSSKVTPLSMSTTDAAAMNSDSYP